MTYTVLCLEASSEAVSVAIGHQGQIYEDFRLAPRQAASLVLPMAEALLARCQLTPADISAVAVTVGPGSFTGVRLGVSVAQGLAFAHQHPVIPITCHEVLAMEAFCIQPDAQSVWVALDARRQEIYSNCYTRCPDMGVRTDTPIEVIKPSDVSAVTADLAIGTAFWRYPDLATLHKIGSVFAPRWPRARYLAMLAQGTARQATACAARDVQPLYVRDDYL